jgi:hypothetical protein
MKERILDWLIANSPIEPIFVFTIVMVIGFRMFYWRDLKNWKTLQRWDKFRVVAGILAIATVLCAGIVVTSRKN